MKTTKEHLMNALKLILRMDARIFWDADTIVHDIHEVAEAGLEGKEFKDVSKYFERDLDGNIVEE